MLAREWTTHIATSLCLSVALSVALAEDIVLGLLGNGLYL